VLDFAKNAQYEKVKFIPHKIDYIRSYVPIPEPNEEILCQVAELINTAQKPFALVGQGVELGNAQNELIDFLEKADIPAGCTLLGLSALSSSHPLNKGMLGMHGNLAANIKTNECDVLIAIGMRFDERVTGNLKTYAKQAKIIHFDIDPAEIDKNVKTDFAIIGNCKKTLSAITKKLNKNSHIEWKESFRENEEKEFISIINPELHPTEGPITMGEVVRAVSDATKNEAVLVTDVGQTQMVAARYFRFTKQRSIVISGGLGAMGFGLPAAIGAAFGAPDRMICLFCGDGGLQMTMQELGTIMETGISVKIILLNNNYLGMVRQWQELFFNKRYSSTPMLNPDYMKIASAYGIKGRSVCLREELPAAINEMLFSPGSYLLEVKVVEKGMVYPMIPAGETINKALVHREKAKI
jgi:acetolactate synthase-1/2/3 large subunit